MKNLTAIIEHMLNELDSHPFIGGPALPKTDTTVAVTQTLEALQAQFSEQQLAIVERALAKLSPDEIKTLAIGDDDTWPPIFAKLGDDHELVHAVYDAVYEIIAVV